jgi:phospholipase D1/2
MAKRLQEGGLKSQVLHTTFSDKPVDDERHVRTRNRKEQHSTTTAVPTVDEENVTEHRTPETPVGDNLISDKLHNQNRHEEGNDYFTPSSSNNASGPSDNPHGYTPNGDVHNSPVDSSRAEDEIGIDDADQEEQTGAGAHVRTHLAGKSGSKTWTLPNPTPKVDPNGFEDPVSDAFWKDVWLACAVHNVRFFGWSGICRC